MNCPNCQSTDILPITYGTPPISGGKLARAVEEKSIILGGCALCGEAPAYCCRSCGHRFDMKREKKRFFFRKQQK